MTFLLNNASANTALLSLQMTQKNLATTQSQLSTGLAVENASDNASYWSIAKTMSSDNGALGAVKSSLAVSASLISTNTSALSASISVVNKIKDELVAAQATGADLTSIGSSITAAQQNLRTIISANSTNGQNLLEGTAGKNEQDAALKAAQDYYGVGTMGSETAYCKTLKDAIDVANTNAGADLTGTATDNLTKAVKAMGTMGSASVSGAMDTYVTALGTYQALASPSAADKKILSDAYTTFKAAAQAVEDAGGATVAQYTALANAKQTASVLNASTPGQTAKTISTELDGSGSLANSGSLSIISGYTNAGGVSSVSLKTLNTTLIDHSSPGYANVGILTKGGTSSTGASVMTMSVSATTTGSDLAAMLSDVDAALKSMSSAATALGAATNVITTQQSFLATMQTNLDNGVASLVDADMNQVSTRLQALQTQQQLGVQSLSIANQSTQMILKLFQ